MGKPAGITWIVISFAIAVSCAGCAPDDDETSESEVVAEADPRFATAEAMLAEFNRFNTKLPRDFPNLLPLVYVENDFQRKKLEVIQRQSSGLYYQARRPACRGRVQ